jgi:hypothetical protein
VDTGSGQWPGHHGQVRATYSEQRRGKRPRHHDQVPVTKNYHGQQSGHHDQVPAWRRSSLATELCESVLVFECCNLWGVARVNAASPV